MKTLTDKEFEDILEYVDYEAPDDYKSVADRISHNIKQYNKLANDILEDTLRLKELGYIWYLSDDVFKTIELKRLKND